MAYVNGTYIAIGGATNFLINSPTIYNGVYVSTDKINWTKKSTNFPATFAFGCVFEDGSGVYAFGGNTGTTSTHRSIYKSSNLGESWEFVAYFPIGIHSAATVDLNGEWYVIGGMTATSIVNDTVYKSIDKGLNWTQVGTLPQVRFLPKGFALNGQLVVVGGQSTASTASTSKVKSIITSVGGVSWNEVSNLPYPVTSNNITVHDDAIAFANKLHFYSRYNSSNAAGVTLFSTTDLITWSEQATTIGAEIYKQFLAVEEATPTTPATLNLSGEISSISTLEGSITVDTGTPPLETLFGSGQIDSVSSLEGSIHIVVTGDLVIQSSVTVNGVAEANVKVLAIRDTDNKVYSTFSNADGSYQIPVETEGNYHIVYLFKDVNTNLYSTKTHPYLYVGGV